MSEDTKRELTHDDMRALAKAVVEVWPELKDRSNTDLVEGWRSLLTDFKIEIAAKAAREKVSH